MKPPVIRVINPNRRPVFRAVVLKLRQLRSRMEGIQLTPEVKELLKPGDLKYCYVEEEQLFEAQLASFRDMQSRYLCPTVTPHTIQLEKFNVRVGPGKMGEYHARNALYLHLIDLQCECKHGVQHDVAARIVEYWRWVRKLKPKQYREHIKHVIRK